IQIIFKEKIDRRKPFLDDITRTHCNYQVTRNDLAWSEYIKKGGNCIEFNEFKSTTTRGSTQWPPSSPSTSRSCSRSPSTSGIPAGLPVPTTTTTRVYLATFKYVHLRAQHAADQRGEIDKDYIWPHSFPHCTPRLREAMNLWLSEEFNRTSRAKCLIIIGPTSTGKTSFAMSLPGYVNYFQERWNLDAWNDYARYSVYDDIPWDDFSKLNFPNKKNLLTQKRFKISVTDKYLGSKQINVRQPAIVLLNPEDAGSLLQAPITDPQQDTAAYWRERAFIYIMGPDEYFYRPQHQSSNNPSDSQVSNATSLTARNEEPKDTLDEWEKMYQYYQQKHPR
ncbi:unnamed protein product, partial [Rotaria sp. Silwood2]